VLLLLLLLVVVVVVIVEIVVVDVEVVVVVVLTNYFADNKIEKNETEAACSAYWGEERIIQGFWWGNLKERDHLEDPGVDGRIILRWIFRKWDVGVWTGSS